MKKSWWRCVPRLPRISGKELIRIFSRIGFQIDRQKGSHIILRNGPLKIIIPNHAELDKGTLRAIIHQTGLSREEFMKLYEKS